MPPETSKGLSIDPALLQRLSDIELRSRFLVRGLFNSRHRTSDFGSSTEFIEHREYRWGDELRNIDWRIFGRADRFYVKVHEMEADMRLHLIVDTSDSMRVAPAPGRLGKLNLACVIAGALAHMVIWQRDSVGLHAVGERIGASFPPRQGDMHLSQIMRCLGAPPGGGSGNLSLHLKDIAARAGSRAMVFIMTDALDDTAKLGEALRIMRQRFLDVTLLRIFDRRELDFPFDRMTEFRDPESGARTYAEPHLVRRSYLRALDEHRRLVAEACRKAEAGFMEIDDTSDLGELLSLHLISRLVNRGSGRC